MSRATLALQLKTALSVWILTFIFVIGFSLQTLSGPLTIEIVTDNEQIDPSHELLQDLQHSFAQMVSDIHTGTLLFETSLENADPLDQGHYRILLNKEDSFGLVLAHSSWPVDTDLATPFIPPVAELIRINSGIQKSTLLSYFQVVFARYLNYSIEELELDLNHVLSEYPAEMMPLVLGLAVEQHRIYRQSKITALVPGQLVETYERALSLSPVSLRGWIHANMADIYAKTPRAEGLLYQAMNQFEKSENDKGLYVVGLMLTEHLETVGRTVAFQQVLTQVKLASGRLGWDSMELPGTSEISGSGVSTEGPAQFQKAEDFAFQAEKSIKAGQWQKAIEQYQKNLELVLELRIEPAIARAYFQLGTLYFQLNDLAHAKEHFLKAADYMEMLADTCGLAKVDNNLGAIYFQMEEWVDAQLRFESALRLEEVCGNPENILRCSVNFGDLRAQQRRWAEAQSYYDRALAIAEQFENKNLMASILYAKGLTHLKEGLLQIGYEELLQASNLSGGSVHGEPEKEQAFLQRLRKLIGEGDSGYDSSALE
jgi:tetratricopeptide (TPR) repeat protein